MKPTELSRTFFDALSGGDFDTVRKYAAEDFKLVQNGSDTPMDAEQTIGMVTMILDKIKTFSYTDCVVSGTATGFVEEHAFTATLPNGNDFSLKVACVCTVDDDGQKITEVREYFDSASAADLLAALAPPPTDDGTETDGENKEE